MDTGLESAVRSDVAVAPGGGPRWTIVRRCFRCQKVLGTFETTEPPAAPESHGLCDKCFKQELIDLDWDIWEDMQAQRKRVEIEMAWQWYYEEVLYRGDNKSTAGE